MERVSLENITIKTILHATFCKSILNEIKTRTIPPKSFHFKLHKTFGIRLKAEIQEIMLCGDIEMLNMSA